MSEEQKTAAGDWQPIASAPSNVELELRHELCPGYDANGLWTGKEWQLDAFFISGKTRLMYSQPTHWRPQQEPRS